MTTNAVDTIVVALIKSGLCPQATCGEVTKLAQKIVEDFAEFDVRKIMLSVTPGPEGMGVEVYAKSVKDVEKTLTKLSDDRDALFSAILAIDTGANSQGAHTGMSWGQVRQIITNVRAEIA